MNWRVEFDKMHSPKRRSTDKWTHKELVEEVKRLGQRLDFRDDNKVAERLAALERRTPRFGWRRG